MFHGIGNQLLLDLPLNQELPLDQELLFLELKKLPDLKPPELNPPDDLKLPDLKPPELLLGAAAKATV